MREWHAEAAQSSMAAMLRDDFLLDDVRVVGPLVGRAGFRFRGRLGDNWYTADVTADMDFSLRPERRKKKKRLL